MDDLAWLVGLGIFGYILIKMLFLIKKRNKHTDLLNEVPIYWTENLGRDFVVLGSVSYSEYSQMEAEIGLIQEAKKLGADAVICIPVSTTSHAGGGVSSSRGFDGKLKIKDTSYIANAFHYKGSAIKFKENIDTTSTYSNVDRFELPTINVEEVIVKLENDSIVEIEKQKKLFDNDIIDEVEFKSRVTVIKNKLIEKKENMLIEKEHYLNIKEYKDKIKEYKDKIKVIENQANAQIDKQKEFLKLNLIERKDYEAAVKTIEYGLAENRQKRLYEEAIKPIENELAEYKKKIG